VGKGSFDHYLKVVSGFDSGMVGGRGQRDGQRDGGRKVKSEEVCRWPLGSMTRKSATLSASACLSRDFRVWNSRTRARVDCGTARVRGRGRAQDFLKIKQASVTASHNENAEKEKERLPGRGSFLLPRTQLRRNVVLLLTGYFCHSRVHSICQSKIRPLPPTSPAASFSLSFRNPRTRLILIASKRNERLRDRAS
jgi:hypothetical protein